MSGLALAVIAGWLVVLAGGFDLVLSARLDQQVNDTLRVRAQAASSTVVVRDGVVTGVRESATDADLDASIWLYAGDRTVVAATAPAAVQRAADRVARSNGTYTDAAGRRFYRQPVIEDGRTVGTLVAAVDTGPYDETRRTAIIGSVVVAGLLIAGAYPILRVTSSRALRPVARMTRQAAEWSVTAPTQRFGERQQYAELDALAGTLDALLDRLAAVLRHERQLSAELSHELRTPLARIIGELDLLLGDERAGAGSASASALRALRADAVSMDSIMDTLLATARAELVRTVGFSELDPVLQSLVDETSTPRVTYVATGLSVGIDADVVTRILAPIVDNARRHARRDVWLAARRDDRGVVVEIANDGPLIAADLSDAVFEPGFRAPATGDAHDGAGLGLALARRLARAADGELSVDTGRERTTFVLVLPAG